MNLGDLEKIITKLTTTKLKDLIKSIRNCKTAADERKVIAKESANIRTAFKEESNDTRHINIAKLLYIHMLGYPAHFGQIECLKLVASPRYSDKRLGYLGIMLLLDENTEVLTLVTNCVKNDLNNANMYIIGLALCTLGNIASMEMSRDLVTEIEKLLGHPNSYVRKKAALCALRVIKKVPELLENFAIRAQTLLNERNHAVLLTGVTLLTEMSGMSNEILEMLRKSVPILVRHMKNLLTSGTSPEHDVGGITDPFLQVKILKLMRIIGKGDAYASDTMNDVLALVATNTDASKNVGDAILYETVLTIMDIESDNSLRVLGINILGKFLQNRDNNIRYVALTTLAKTAKSSQSSDSSALQRHRATIIECLRDPDISIRRRALDLSFFLINSQNIRLLTRELLSFLEICEGDIKSSVANRICDFAGRYRPNKRWELDTVIRVLRVAGAYVDQWVVTYFTKLVSTGPAPLYSYAIRKLYGIISTEGERALVQEGLLQATFWTIGEYGDLLIKNASDSSTLFSNDEDDKNDALGYDSSIVVTEKEVVDLIDKTLRGPYATTLVKEYALTALSKLTTRFKDEYVFQTIKTIVSKYKTSVELELQQRSVEYSGLWTLSKDMRLSLLDRVPVLESAVSDEAKKGTGASLGVDPTTPKVFKSKEDLIKIEAQDDIYNMVFGNSQKPATNSNDILGLIDNHSVYTTPQKPASNTTALDDIFGTSSQKINEAKNYVCYSKNNLTITLTTQARPSGQQFCDILVQFSNSSGSVISNIGFLVAVPKTLKLLMQPASNSTIQPGKQETQLMRIENPSMVAVKLRLKLSYSSSNGQTDEIVEFSSFDSTLWA